MRVPVCRRARFAVFGTGLDSEVVVVRHAAVIDLDGAVCTDEVSLCRQGYPGLLTQKWYVSGFLPELNELASIQLIPTFWSPVNSVILYHRLVLSSCFIDD